MVTPEIAAPTAHNPAQMMARVKPWTSALPDNDWEPPSPAANGTIAVARSPATRATALFTPDARPALFRRAMKDVLKL
ncbi:MAG: hypothetical protein ABIZ36_10610 [Gemmatimonadaceae bacterium]